VGPRQVPEKKKGASSKEHGGSNSRVKSESTRAEGENLLQIKKVIPPAEAGTQASKRGDVCNKIVSACEGSLHPIK